MSKGEYPIKIQLTSRGHYGKSHVRMRQPKIRDIRTYLSMPGSSVSAKNAFIESIVEDDDISWMTVADREWLFITARVMIKSDIISDSFKCSTKDCDDSVLVLLDLNKVKVDELPDDFQKDFEFTFPVSKEKKVINVLTVAQEELLGEYVSMYQSGGEKMRHAAFGDTLPDVARYACMFKDSVDFKSLDENVAFLDNLDWDDFESLMLYDLLFDCTPEVVTEAKCDTCGKKYKVKFDSDKLLSGTNINSFLRQHRFLARTSNIDFNSFLEYTYEEMKAVSEDVSSQIQKQKDAMRKARRK